MRIRRCTTLWLEPRQRQQFRLDDVLQGGTGVINSIEWFAHAPHCPAPVAIDAEDVALLGGLAPGNWMDAAQVCERHGTARVEHLLQSGLLIGRGDAWSPHRDADEDVRRQHWQGLAATWHAASRWEGVDAAGDSAAAGLDTTQGLRAVLGPPPPMFHERGEAAATMPLERARRTPFDELLDARATCRNFDTVAELPVAQLAQVLERTFGARGQDDDPGGVDVLKKTSASGGALHPTECYVIARRVSGLPSGLYHYRAGDHALRPLPLDEHALGAAAAAHAEATGISLLDAFAWVAVGGQRWLADAHALCVMAPRFDRTFWKYRDHAKAYRVCILDVGHLSQTFQLCATDAGLGSYVTAAINEVDIERALGLVHWREGPLAICGLGVRSATRRKRELDPNGKAWPRA